MRIGGFAKGAAWAAAQFLCINPCLRNAKGDHHSMIAGSAVIDVRSQLSLHPEVAWRQYISFVKDISELTDRPGHKPESTHRQLLASSYLHEKS